jgi:hypothetical protein
MPDAKDPKRISDGFVSLEGGINSGKVPTVESPLNPGGVRRNQVWFAVNATMRGGSIMPRPGVFKRTLDFGGDATLQTRFEDARFQGGAIYDPDVGDNYLMLSIGGRIFRVNVTSGDTVEDLTNASGVAANASNLTQAWFVQGEQFEVIQDGQSPALIWDGTTLRRSGPTEIPIGTAMDYYMGRLWLANGRSYTAGGIVGGSYGTPGAPYYLRDSILKWTENTYIANGGAFIVPLKAGNITALKHSANLDSSLGEGQLLVFCRDAVFSTTVPPDRTTWAALTEPLQRVAQIGYGATSQDGTVLVNGDMFYRSPLGISSLFVSIRNFQQWGNTAISTNMNRILRRDDRSLLRYVSGVEFDNRLLHTVSPVSTEHGIYFRGLAALDFDLISSLDSKAPPAWEGMWTGLNILKILKASFGGMDRCFLVVLNAANKIELWELSMGDRWDNVDKPITWFFEGPAYDFRNAFQRKLLDGGAIWIDRLAGPVHFNLRYRPDQHPCYYDWLEWDECASTGACDDLDPPDGCYVPQDYREQYRASRKFPQPNDDFSSVTGPARELYQCQPRLDVSGFARIRALRLDVLEKFEAQYA